MAMQQGVLHSQTHLSSTICTLGQHHLILSECPLSFVMPHRAGGIAIIIITDCWQGTFIPLVEGDQDFTEMEIILEKTVDVFASKAESPMDLSSSGESDFFSTISGYVG